MNDFIDYETIRVSGENLNTSRNFTGIQQFEYWID
jgi:hypothetical protein